MSAVLLFREEVSTHRKARLQGAVILTQPMSTRILVVALFTIIMILAIWFSLGTYARVETVPGLLVTDRSSAKVIAQQAGVVTAMLVAEGQAVEKGDHLLVINSDRASARGGLIAGRGLGALEARRALSEAQIGLAESRASAERTRLKAIVSSSENQAENLLEQIVIQEQLVASNQRIFDQISKVVDQGFVSKVEYERRRQTLLGSQQSLASLRQRLTETQAQAQQARAQLTSVSIEKAQGVSQIQERIQALSAEEARLEGEQSYVITSPSAGRVTALAIGEGRPVSSGRPLMTIVPEGAVLSAELYAPTRAIGFVEPGKETRLLYDAFPYQRFGSFRGKVSQISQIAIDPRETDIPFPIEEPVYRIQVQLDQQSVYAFGQMTSLQPGMTLQANIVLERQSFLAWLLQPLNAVLKRNS